MKMSGAGKSTPVWTDAALRPNFPILTTNDRADVCIVGAGLAGLTTAYFLTKAGKSVIVIDDGPLFSGETGRTTAHLVTVLDKRYFELARLYGEEKARLAAESHNVAIDTIEDIIRQENIACDFERVDGYLFNAPGQPAELLERELAAAQCAGLGEVEKVGRAPFPSFNTGPALRFPHQAQFHPLKYLGALAKAIICEGGRIFTGTHATEIHGGKSARVETQNGSTITCQSIVVATHTPINDRFVLHTKQAAYRSYVLGLAVPAGEVTKALYWDTGDPYHYMRLATAKLAPAGPEQEILIVGGEDHKTGQADDAAARYARLEQWARERVPMAGRVHFRWSGQIMEAVDGLAFIGRNPVDDENVYIVTGDSGTGMMHGTIAGILITDLIHGRKNPWTELYSPSRVTVGAAKAFARETLNMASQYVNWLTAGDAEKEQMIAPGTGAVVRHGLKKIAVYRETDGTFHECSAVCPHLGAIVGWNHADKTWDCPAHGSRFDRIGRVLHGPANKALHPADALNPAEATAHE